MDTITLQLKHGPMDIGVENTDRGWRRWAQYRLTLNGRNRVLTSYSKPYRTERGAANEAQKFAGQQKVVLG